MGWAKRAIPLQLTAWVDAANPPSDAEHARAYVDAYERLQKGLGQLPLPFGFREAILGLRAIIRVRRAEGSSTEEPLRLMHWLAAAESFRIPFAARLHEPGYNVFEAAPERDIRRMALDWNSIGCDSLSILTKTDRKLMRETWGTPDNHTTAHALYESLWLEIEDRLIKERAARSGMTPEIYIEHQRTIYAEITRENEERSQSIEAERTAHRQAGHRIISLIDKPVFLDIETTGLSPDVDEVIEIGIVDAHGRVLLDQPVRPERALVWPEAERIHGISPAHVRSAPRLREVESHVNALVTGKLVVIYNAAFDIGFLPPSLLSAAGGFVCAMELYKSVQPGGRAGLVDAERWAGIRREEARRHRAAADANATRLIWERVKEQCSANFPTAVVRAVFAPEVKAMRDERLVRERARRTITVHIEEELHLPQPTTNESAPNARTERQPGTSLPKWGLIITVAVIVALLLAVLS